LEDFFKKDSVCPHCNASLKETYIHGKNTGVVGVYMELLIWQCERCGWWRGKQLLLDEQDNIDTIDSYRQETIYLSVVKRFSVDDKLLPLNALMSELQKRPEMLYHIAPSKLEEVAQSVLRNFFDCDVKHVGKTGDGGIDLIVIDSESPILVQVKRRADPERTELVKEIREFVGTLFIEDKRRGIFLSTARNFSKGSQKVREASYTSSPPRRSQAL